MSSTTPNPGKLKGLLYLPNPTIEQHDSSSGFEGSSSLTAHGAYASAFLESAVSKSSPQVLSSPKINAALSSLKQLVGIQNQRREVDLQGGQPHANNARLGVRRDIRDLEMPPLAVVLDMLRKIQGMFHSKEMSSVSYSYSVRNTTGLLWWLCPLSRLEIFH